MLSIVTPDNLMSLLQSYGWLALLFGTGIFSYFVYRVVDGFQIRHVKNASRPPDLERLNEQTFLAKRERKRERSVKMFWKAFFSWAFQGAYALVGIPLCVYWLAQQKLSYATIYLVLIAGSFLVNMLLSKVFTLWTPSRPFACRDFRSDPTWSLRNMSFQAWGLLVWAVPTYFFWSFYQAQGWIGSVIFLVIGQVLQVFVFIYFIKRSAIPYQDYPGLSEGFKKSLHEYLQKQGMGDHEVGVLKDTQMGANAFATSFFGYRQIVLTEELIKGYDDPGNPDFTLKLGEDTLEAIIAHEMGHIKHRHVELGILLGVFISGAVTALVYQLFSADPKTYFLFDSSTSTQIMLYWGESIFSAMLMYPLTALLMSIKRRHEYQADTFMLETNGCKNGQDFFHQMRHIAPIENHPAWHSLNMTHPPADVREERIRKWADEFCKPKGK